MWLHYPIKMIIFEYFDSNIGLFSMLHFWRKTNYWFIASSSTLFFCVLKVIAEYSDRHQTIRL